MGKYSRAIVAIFIGIAVFFAHKTGTQINLALELFDLHSACEGGAINNCKGHQAEYDRVLRRWDGWASTYFGISAIALSISMYFYGRYMQTSKNSYNKKIK